MRTSSTILLLLYLALSSPLAAARVKPSPPQVGRTAVGGQGLLPPRHRIPGGLSPLSVFSSGTVFLPNGGSFFSAKKVQAGTVTEDTYFGNVLVPAGGFVRLAQYATTCAAPECANLVLLSPAQRAQIQTAVLNRGAEVSRLDPSNFMAQRNSALRHVWRWGSLGDSLPIPPGDIALYRDAGVFLIPTLSADNPAHRAAGFGGSKGCMTDDLSNNFNSAWGYSRVYFDWVTRLVTTYAEIMPLIVIENEVDQVNNTWCEPLGVREGYRKMVVTAKYAIRQAGVSVLVADSGMMGGTWTRLALVDLVAQRAAVLNQGGTPDPQMEQQILELLSQIRSTIPETTGGLVDWPALETEVAQINTLPMQNAREVIRLLSADVIDPDLSEPALDVYNFHYHGTSSAMPAVAQYVRRVFATHGAPLINHEMDISADRDAKTLAAQNASLLTWTEFLPVTTATLQGEVEAQGGVTAFGTLTPLAPRVEQLATADLVKQFIHAFGNGVSNVTYFGFNAGKTSTFQVPDGQPYDFFRYTWLNFGSSISEDHLLVAPNFRAILNLRALFDGSILSSTHQVAGALETYGFELPHKSLRTWWIQAFVSHIGLTRAVDVSTLVAAGYRFYDEEGFPVNTPGNLLTVGLAPLFAEQLH